MRAYKPVFLVLVMMTCIMMVAAGQEAALDKNNPFFSPYTTPLNTPPFNLIKNEHFVPAIKEGIRRQQAEIDAIVNNTAAPTFANTLAAFDASGPAPVRGQLGVRRPAGSRYQCGHSGDRQGNIAADRCSQRQHPPE